jgi:hypothetical protein
VAAVTHPETGPLRPGCRTVRKLAEAVEALRAACRAPHAVAALLLDHDHAHLAALTAAEPEPGRCDVAVRVVRSDTAQTLRDEHLRVRLPHPQPWPSVADVLVEAQPAGRPWREAAQRARTLAGDCPGALVVAVHSPSQCVVRTPGDRLLRLTARTGGRPHWATWASLLHAWLVAGVPSRALAPTSAHLLHLPPRDGANRPAAWDQAVTLHPLP